MNIDKGKIEHALDMLTNPNSGDDSDMEQAIEVACEVLKETLEEFDRPNIKICPQCGKVVSYNSYFGGYLCQCGLIKG